MKMPQDFLDAITAARREVNPNASATTSGSFTLGSDFDEWLGPGSLTKYGLGPFPADFMAGFEAKFEERREEIKAALVASAVDVERRIMAGEAPFDFDDSNRPSSKASVATTTMRA